MSNPWFWVGWVGAICAILVIVMVTVAVVIGIARQSIATRPPRRSREEMAAGIRDVSQSRWRTHAEDGLPAITPAERRRSKR